MEPQNNKITVPIAIVIAGVVIGGAILLSNTKIERVANKAPTDVDQPATAGEIRPISADDHILGNPNAAITVIEYSDLECPYCKVFHQTMHRIIDEYGKEGEVAWVYRHFPLDQLHPKARKEAEATECAAELGGNSAFWKYTDRLFEITPSNNGLDPAKLPEIAKTIGLDVTKFNACLSSSKFAERVNADVEDAIKTGGRGTPWSIIVTADGAKETINGAEPYDMVKGKIDQLLTE